MSGFSSSLSIISPPKVYDYSSCIEYSRACKDYWDIHFTVTSVLLGLLTKLTFLWGIPDDPTSLRTGSICSTAGGIIAATALKVIGHPVTTILEEKTRFTCEEDASQFASFQRYKDIFRCLNHN